MKKNIIIKSSLIALIALVSFVSCEDDSLPEAGSIADANPPEGAFFFTDSSESVLIKNITNSSRRGSTEVKWTLPEGAEFWFNTLGVLTTSSDDEIVVRFPTTIDDPNDPLAGYQVGIEAIDALGVSSGVEFFTVQVNLIEGIPEATPAFKVEDGDSNFERILTNESANASAGIVWSVFKDDVELDINQILDTSNINFLTQNSSSDQVLMNFPGSGDFEVTVTATNFNGIETTDSQVVTVEPLTNPIPEFTYTSNENYSVQTLVNTTPDTASVLWTLNGGATLESGALTDETIQVRFPSSGDYIVNLEVTSAGFDENGNPIDLVSLDADELITIPIITSIADITDVPMIIGGDFERPIDENLSEEGLARTNNDLGKEYWLPDGLSTRVLDPITKEAFAAYPGETSANERTWFASGLFNRIGITSSGREGNGATWDASEPDPRAIAQYIAIIPGVDYKVSFNYSNDLNSTTESLVGFILDASVVSEIQITPDTTIAQELFNEQSTSYTEGSLTFTVTSSNAEAIKLYFNTTTVAGDYRLDDISIAID